MDAWMIIGIIFSVLSVILLIYMIIAWKKDNVLFSKSVFKSIRFFKRFSAKELNEMAIDKDNEII